MLHDPPRLHSQTNSRDAQDSQPHPECATPSLDYFHPCKSGEKKQQLGKGTSARQQMESTRESPASPSGIQSQFSEFNSQNSGAQASAGELFDSLVANDIKTQAHSISMEGSEESPEFGNRANKDCNTDLTNEKANKNQVKDSKQSETMTGSRQAGYELSQPSSQHQPTIIYRVTQKQDTSPKKKRRQQGVNMDGSEESTESGDGANNIEGVDCSHFNKAVNVTGIRRATKEKKMTSKCSDCEKQGIDTNDNQDEFSDDPQMWICLQCGNVACGRAVKGHAIVHYEKPRSDEHCVVVDTHTWRLWCYKCDDSVNTQNPSHKKRLQEALDLLKKWAKAKPAVQPKPPIPLCQNETPNFLESENKKKLTGLPKIGGLVNLGNTCFFNSVLQCLAQTPYLIQVLDDLQVPDQTFLLPGGKQKVTEDEVTEMPPIEGVLETPITFTPVLRKTLSDMQNSQGSVYRPTDLYHSLRKKNNYCTDGGQHDSHELLRHLLECVRNEDVRRYQAVILEKLGLSDKTNRKNIDESLKTQVKFYGNQANAKFLGPERAFRGELVSTLECLECGHTSCREEPFLDLSLPVLIDKSLPTIIKRKTNFENSVDSMGNNVAAPLSKHQMKKAQKAAVKNRRAQKNRNGAASTSTGNHTSEEMKDSVAGSDESDADVEDNAENDDASPPEIIESGYSSEKVSAVTSPVSLSDLRSTGKPCGFHNLNVEGDSSANDEKDEADSKTSNGNVNHTNFTWDDETVGPADEDKSEAGNRNSILNGTGSLALSTSLGVNSDFTSPEGPTISPLSSPLTSKDSPTSPIFSAVDGEDEKADKSLPILDDTDKRDLSDKEGLSKYSFAMKMTTGAPGGSLFNEGPSSVGSFRNGVGDITSNISKFELASPNESPHGYPVKDGECSVQLCLNQFTALELMSGNNKVGCAACTDRKNKGKKGKMVCTESTKQYLISKVPAVLILHLKRFQAQRYSFRKVGKHVSFPMILDLSPVTKNSFNPKIYALYGVVEHSGTMYGGHYVAYVKSRFPLKKDDSRWSFLPSKDGFENNSPIDSPNDSNSELENGETEGATSSQIEPPPGRWYYVSDSRFHEVDEKTVLNSEAYLLFYERIV